MCGGQRAARLPLVHMVVPLVATSNAFAPLADDDDQPTASRDATSAMDPAPSAISEVMRVRWTEVMTTLSARRSITDTLGMDAGIAWDGHLLTTMPLPQHGIHRRILAIDWWGTDLRLASLICLN